VKLLCPVLWLLACCMLFGCTDGDSDQAARSQTDGDKPGARRPASNASAVMVPKLAPVLYVEPVHSDFRLYPEHAESLIQNLMSRHGEDNFHLVLWADESRTHGTWSKPAKVYSGKTVSSDFGRVQRALRGARATPNPAGFVRGLQVCEKLATSKGGQIIVLLNAPVQLSGAQKSVLKGIAGRVVVSVIVYGGSADEFVPLIGGYAISVRLGDN